MAMDPRLSCHLLWRRPHLPISIVHRDLRAFHPPQASKPTVEIDGSGVPLPCRRQKTTRHWYGFRNRFTKTMEVPAIRANRTHLDHLRCRHLWYPLPQSFGVPHSLPSGQRLESRSRRSRISWYSRRHRPIHLCHHREYLPPNSVWLIFYRLLKFYINPGYVKTAKRRGGAAKPEDRLAPAIWGGILVVIGVAGFAATDGPDIHWSAPILFGIPFGLGLVVAFLSVLSYLVDSYTIYAASVLAANSILRSFFGAGFPLFTIYM